jgi:hypothetical protein
MLLKLALFSLTESMRKDPDKYSSLIYLNTSSAANYNSQYYDTDSYGQQQQYQSQNHSIEAYTDKLIDEAEKLYNKLAKEIVNKIITDYPSKISSSLPFLIRSDEEKEQQ